MRHTRSSGAILLAAVLVAGYFSLDPGRAGGGSVHAPERVDRRSTTGTALGAPAASVSSRVALADTPSTRSRLPAAGVDVSASGATGDIAGIVVDSHGRPMAAAVVHLDVAGSDSIRGALSAHARARPEAEWAPVQGAVTTDMAGGFVFTGIPTADGGDLSVTAEDFPEYTHHHSVDPGAPLQVVRFPEPLASDSEWVVEVVDTQGGPLLASSVTLRFLGHAAQGVVRLAGREVPRIERGRIVVDALAPGRWELEVAAPGTFGGFMACRVEGPRWRVTSRLVIEQHVGEILSSTVEVSALDGLPWFDGTSGLGRWAPAARRGLGGDTSDQHFVATLRCGFGPVTGAELVLELRASTGMVMNDTLSLEFVADGTFRWQGKLAEFAPSGTTRGSRSTVRLDLARLPVGSVFSLETMSLLPDLADGLLDVVVQDDTTVEAITLRVAR